jgi:hypothetical protein
MHGNSNIKFKVQVPAQPSLEVVMTCSCHSRYDTASTAKLSDFLSSLLHGERISKRAVPKSSSYMKTVLHVCLSGKTYV